MRDIDTIFLHCSATPPSRDIDVEDVRKWHTSEPRNWKDVGYHYFIKLDGTIEVGRDLDQVGAHVRGANKTSVGICYAGGVNEEGEIENTMNRRQRAAIVRLVRSLRIVLGHRVELLGHRDHANTKKACPSFDVRAEFRDVTDWLDAYEGRG